MTGVLRWESWHGASEREGTLVADLRFVDGLIGNSAPVLALYKKLFDMGVRLERLPGKISPHTGNGSEFATADWHRKNCMWKIYFPTNAHAHQVYHELLHVHFKDVEGAPMMSACQYDESLCRNVEELNNDFDHAYVVPLEIAQYPEAARYWEADFNRMFSQLPFASLDQLSAAQKKLTLHRGWLILPIAMPMAEITQKFRSELITGEWLEVANAMTTRVRDAGADKVRAVQAFREALGFDYPPTAKVVFSQ
jgi:hypothetical protein